MLKKPIHYGGIKITKLIQSLIDISESLEGDDTDMWHWKIIAPIAKQAIAHIESLEAQNKKLVKALEFYADKNRWNTTKDLNGMILRYQFSEYLPGHTAQQTLDEVKK